MKRQLYRVFFSVLMALTLSLVVSDAYSQCAMCRATVESNVGTGSKEPESQVGAGLNTGILYLMLIPYILVGTVGFLWYRSSRKKNTKAA
ncbi:hypothetical protein H9Q13_11620 [Pontibacter sp. JH31]|uniref:Uncharacterized protein n=1 Tax=Pontibacter aquaedesilientis TaxID=2766980 RepID=A0ABR7XHN7_9BACT|nr:hypothetical protein [Pontibacter aquaedesilientis]MBD1397814.1 hypothetical protein [Pontibacter aquaedesilientis]